MSNGLLYRLWLMLGAALFPFSMAQATVVEFDATSLGGNLWQYSYTITNTSPSLSFNELTVYFDYGRYSSLSLLAAPVGWDPIVIQPDTGIPADGYYDVLNLSGPLAPGESISGFSVSFSYLATGVPGAQPFDLIDASTFALVYAGTTSAATVAAVPEPETYAMMLLGLGILGVTARRRTGLRT